jgi:hypothetical protein
MKPSEDGDERSSRRNIIEETCRVGGEQWPDIRQEVRPLQFGKHSLFGLSPGDRPFGQSKIATEQLDDPHGAEIREDVKRVREIDKIPALVALKQ